MNEVEFTRRLYEEITDKTNGRIRNLGYDIECHGKTIWIKNEVKFTQQIIDRYNMLWEPGRTIEDMEDDECFKECRKELMEESRNRSLGLVTDRKVRNVEIEENRFEDFNRKSVVHMYTIRIKGRTFADKLIDELVSALIRG